MNNYVKTWQQLHGVNNVKLAKLVRARGEKCHESMISHYHNGRKNFSPTVGGAIAEICGLTLGQVLLPTKNV